MRLRLAAPAKLNLVLEVLGRRPDGFHELVSVVQCVSLSDRLEAEPGRDVTLDAPPEAGPLDANLAHRAAVELRSASGTQRGATLTLAKRIPVGAGLGGGSSDGAAALRLLERLWGVRPGAVEVPSLAASLGSDVPLFLAGPAALVRGRGERVSRLPALRHGVFVLVVPPWRIKRKTARVFAALAPGELSSGVRAAALATALEGDEPVSHGLFWNGLHPAAERVFGELAALKHALERATGVPFALSGAGPTLFHLAASAEDAAACAGRARRLAARVYAARPLRRRPAIRRMAG